MLSPLDKQNQKYKSENNYGKESYRNDLRTYKIQKMGRKNYPKHGYTTNVYSILSVV